MNLSSSSYSLQITIISGESLTMPSRKRHLTKNLYVQIWPETNTNQILDKDLHRRTNICEDDINSYDPAWNEALVINNVPVHVKYFVLEVRYSKSSSSSSSSYKSIGFARVPVSDFINAAMPWNYLHFLSYRLRDRYGRRNGIINFSVQVLEGNGLEFDRVYCRDSNGGGLSNVVKGWGSGGSGATAAAAVGVPASVWYNSCHAI